MKAGLKQILEEVRRFLRENADDKTRESARRFFKEKVVTHGVKFALVNKMAEETFRQRLKDESKKSVFALCEELWRSGYLEEGGVACIWAHNLRAQYQPADFGIFEDWIDKYINNWGMCDTFCNHSLAAFVERYPEFILNIKGWTALENRWKKRAAAVTFILPARKGLWLADLFEIADRLLSDRDDLVQKGYGWMLKAASEAHPAEVFDFLMARRETMPRTAFRYALEKMPSDWRTTAMAKVVKKSCPLSHGD